MGMLSDALNKRPSAYGTKKTDLFAEVKDRIDAIMLQAQMVDVEAWLDLNEHTFPNGWRECFEDMLILKREELDSEDIGNILRDRFDF